MNRNSVLIPVLIVLVILAVVLRFGGLAQARDPGSQLAMPGMDVGAVESSAPPAAVTATQRLVRISQLDPAQYVSVAQYHEWSGAACSAGSLTMVLDAYGQHFIIGQVIPLFGSSISPNGGLLNDQGLAYAASQVHFGASLSHSRALDQVVAIANSGLPVIVDVRSADLFPAGHFMVVLGGDAHTLHLAESSSVNIQWMSRAWFASMWEGLSAVIGPPSVLATQSL